MLCVGLTGGLATGKSFVGKTLSELGCLWIQADVLGHQVLAPGGVAYDDVLREFGKGILKEDGSVDRVRLANEVFGKPERLETLNRLVHPPVIAMEEAMIREFAERNPSGIAVVEAAILVEHGGGVHGAPLNRMAELCPEGAVQLLASMPGAFLVRLNWDEACKERLLAGEG